MTYREEIRREVVGVLDDLGPTIHLRLGREGDSPEDSANPDPVRIPNDRRVPVTV